MANKKLMATAELFLNTKNAKKDAQKFIDDIKQKLTDIETAADKMTVFKNMVGYIAQVDRALTMLKTNNADVFNSMFNGLDANLKKQLEGIFSIDGSKLGQIDLLREKLNTLTLKSSIKEVRDFAKEINDLFASIGVRSPFENIDEKFSGRVTTEHLKTLAVELANFATVWEDVGVRVSKGFGLDGAIGGKVGGLSDELQAEIDKLKKQKQEYQEIIDVFNGKKISIETTKQNDVDILKQLRSEMQAARSEMDRLNKSGMSGSKQYYQAIAQYTRAAALFKNTYLNVADNGSRKGQQYTYNTDALSSYEEAERHLDQYLKKNTGVVEQIKSMYSNLALEVNSKLNDIGNTSSGSTEQNVKSKISAYDELKSKIQEYFSLQDRVNNDDSLTDRDTDKLYNKIDILEQYFLSLDKLGNKQNEIKTILGDLAFGDINTDSALKNLCDLLGVQIPQAVNKTSESLKAVTSGVGNDNSADAVKNIGDVAESSKNKVDTLTESLRKTFLQATELELSRAKSKETMSLFGADGTVNSVIGQNLRVDTDTIVGQLISNLKNNIVMSLHNHSNGNDMFSPQDLESFAKIYYSQGSKINGIIVDGMVKTIDFTGISQELAIKIAKSYADSIKSVVSKNSNLLTFKDGHVDYTDFVKNLKVADPNTYRDIILATQNEINQCLNNAFIQNGVQPTIKQFEHDQLPELAKQLIELQNNAQGAISPVEKLKNLISNMYPNKSFDWGNYTEILKQFGDGAIDGTQAINKILNLETASANVKALKTELTNMFSGINLSDTSYLHVFERLQEGALSYADALKQAQLVYQNNRDLEDSKSVMNTVSALNKKTLSYEELTNAINAYITANNMANRDNMYREQMANAQEKIMQRMSFANLSSKDWSSLESGNTTIDAFVAKLQEAQSQAKKTQETITDVKQHIGSTVSKLTTSMQPSASQSGLIAGDIHIDNEISKLDALRAKLGEVRAAVDEKTKAFEAEYAAVDAAVNAELTSLQMLLNKLMEIAAQITIINDGFTGLGSVLNATTHGTVSNIDSALTIDGVQKIENNNYALDSTLLNTNNILSDILNAVSNNNGVGDLFRKLELAIGELKNVVSSINQAKPKQLLDRSVGSNRIANDYGQLASIANSFVSSSGTEPIIKGMQVLADGITVRVEGAIKSVDGAWKGFIADIDQSNNVINHSINEQSVFAKSLNEIANSATLASNNVKEVTSAPADNKFTSELYKQQQAFDSYKNSLNNVDYLTDELRSDLNDLGVSLRMVTNRKDLDAWSAGFDAVKRSIAQVKSDFLTINTGTINLIQKELTSSYGKLDFSQKETLSREYLEVIAILERQKQTVKEGHAVELDGIKKITAALQEKINMHIEANKQAKEYGASKVKNESFGSTAYINAHARYKQLTEQAGMETFVNSTAVQSALTEYTHAYDILINKMNQFRSQDVITEQEKADFKIITADCNRYADALDRMIKKSLELRSKAGDGGIYTLGSDINPSNIEQIHASMNDFVSSLTNGRAKLLTFNDAQRTATYEVTNAQGQVQQLAVEYDQASHSLVAYTSKTKMSMTETQKFLNSLKHSFKNVVRYLSTFGSVYRLFAVIKKGLTYIKEIDSALTELKKVTDETDASYDQFLQDMSKTGSVIGATVKDLTIMASEWARLGYSMEEAGKLAKSTAILLNVSEFKDATAASEALISTMQAFQYTADESMHVVDILNEVGNNYAVSSDGLAIALQDSASALMAGGNNLEQAVALIAAANRVVQDPNSVGSALRTISLRLRGTSVEVLEQMGEETEGVVESTSKLQEKIKALSGVNILTDTGEYKDTYTILKEIGQVWEDMSDIDQAALLELMAGKNRANTLSAILSNMTDLEGAYNDALSAEGSALKENDDYLDSIQGRIDLFNNSVQTMWMNFIDSEVAKFIVDVGTGLIKLVDNIGVLKTALIGIGVYFTAIKKHNPLTMFRDMGTSLQNYNNTVRQIGSINSIVGPLGAMKIEQFKVGPVKAYAAAVSNLSAKQQAATLAASGLNAEQIKAVLAANNLDDANIKLAMSEAGVAQAKTQNISATGLQIAASMKQQGVAISQDATNFLLKHSTDQVTKSMLAKAVAVGEISHKEAVLILKSMGVVTANTAQAFSWKALGTAIKGAFMSNPVGMLLTIGTTILSLIPIFGMFGKSAKESAEEVHQAAEKATQAYTEAKNEIEQNLKSLTESSDKNLYDTLIDEFTQLTKGVNNLGENVSLTAKQYERYKTICEDIVGIAPALAKGHDNATAAIGNNADALKELIELEKEKQRQNALNYITGDNWDNVVKDSINQYKDAKDQMDDLFNQGNAQYYSGYTNSNNETMIAHTGSLIDRFVGVDNTSGFFTTNAYNYTELMDQFKELLSTLGYSKEEIEKIIADYTYSGNGNLGYRDIINVGEWIVDNLDFLVENSHLLSGEFAEAVAEYEVAKNNIKTAQMAMVDTLLEVPKSMKQFGDLSDSGQSFIYNWIENSGMFKIDDKTTADTILKWKQAIKSMIAALSNDTYTYTLNDGTVVTAQDIIDSIISIDPSSVDWASYQEQIGILIDYLWNAIGGENNTLGFKDKKELALVFNFDIQLANDNESKMIQRYAQIKGITEEEAKAYFDSLPAATVQRLLKVDWNIVDKDNVDNVINQNYGTSSIISTKTYSVILESVENYNEILAQTSEIVVNNTEVTQEYKDSLLELGISEEELNKCFDENNKLVVKDAKALNNLVKAAKKNTAENIRLAKSQAVLDYYELYREIEKLRAGQTTLNASTAAAIKTKYAEMGALQKTIAKYALLEAGLNDVIRTYDEFAEAQEFDNETNYIATVEEMITALGEAFSTGKLGTETAQVAIRGLIPEDVYQDIEALDTAEEKMSAIYDYFKNGKLDQYFDIVFDEDGNLESAEMKLGNLRKFIEDGLYLDENGDGINVFEGTDWQHFELSEEFLAGLKTHLDAGGDGLQYFADQMGVTKEVALAFFKAIEDHDIEWLMGDYSSLIEQIVPSTLESKICDTVQALADLDAQLASDTITPEEYAAEYQKLNSSFESLGQEARAQIELYNNLTEQLEEQKNIMDGATKILNDPTASKDDKDAALKSLTEATTKAQELSGKLKDIELTEVVIQFALDNVDAEIADLKTKIQNQLGDKIAIGENGQFTLKVDLGSLSDDERAMLDEWKKLWEERHEIEVETDPANAQTALELIESSAQSALDVIKSIDGTTIIINTSSAVKNVNDLRTALQDLAGVEIVPVKVQTPTYTPSGNDSKETSRANWRDIHFRKMAIADGTAHASGDWGLPTSEHNSLVGELGPELVVDPTTSRYYTVGDNGAEMVDLKRGSIIFNHKQTEALLKNGHIASRGKAYAEGNAHVTIWPDASSETQWEGTGYDGPDDESISDAFDDATDSVNKFKETLDWIEIRMEEYDERINKFSAELENITTYWAKNDKIDQIIKANQKKYADSLAGAKYYEEYANKYLAGMNGDLVAAAKNGAIAITEFTKEQDEATVEAIQNYRDYAQKAADLYQQAEEILTDIRDSVIQKIDNIQAYGDAKTSIEDLQTEKLQNMVDYMEARGEIPSSAYYGTNGGNADNSTGMFENSYKKIDYWTPLLKDMQAEFDEAVQNGQIIVGSIEWYEQLEKLYQVQAEIDAATMEIEEFQNAINDIHWENFDHLINHIQYLKDETQSLIDLMDNDDMFTTPDEGRKYEGGTVEYWTADDVKWTNEGIASLGLYAQQMEIAEFEAKQYAEAIDDLTADYKAGLYSENEYCEKLNELKEAQYESIEAYYDAQDAIVELNEARIDAIKDGIEKEVEAYEELIEKKKEALDAEKDLYDFQKSTMEQQKNIADIERQLAALANDNSLSATAKRKQLEAELAEAQYELQDTYYNRSVEDKQSALDKELEDFQAEKDAELIKWDEHLANVELVVAESLGLIQSNASGIYDTLSGKAQEYDLTVSDAIMSPWQDGALAVSDYQESFDTAMSSTTNQLELLKNKWQELINKITEAGRASVNAINQENANYAAATKKETVVDKPTNNTPAPTQKQEPQYSTYTVKSGDNLYAIARAQLGDSSRWKDIYNLNKDIIKNPSLIYPGWKLKLPKYAKGTTGVNKDQWALIDELGEELTLHAQNGKLAFLTKGSAVLPHDISENLMALGSINPQEMLDRNRPAITTPHVINNEINITMEIGEVVHIDHVDHDTLPDLTKTVRKEMDSYMAKLNGVIRSKVR